MKQPRLGDVLWYLQPEDVLKEIGQIMNMASVDTNTPGWFNHRTKATKNIISNMTDAEKEELQRKAEKIGEIGLPEEVKRR